MDEETREIEELEQLYFQLIEPKNLIEQFESEQEFIDWLHLDEDPETIEIVLYEFQQAELYEYCVIIKNYLQTLK